MNALKTVITPIHREGYLFIGIFAAISLGLSWIAEPLGWIGFFATCWCVYFFRDPTRVTPQNPTFVISPADGMVSKIEAAAPPPEMEMGDEELTRISVFLNVFNVHVNRNPVAGKITKLHYHAGKFFNASLDKASIHNERQTACVETSDGKEIVFVQIAGLVARRIVCHLHEGQEVEAGSRYGLIRFGSRCDIYLPKGVNPLVVEGQTMIGGETVLADLKSKEKARTGIES